MNAENQYIQLYTSASDTIKAKSCEVMNRVRDHAFHVFEAQGFPTKKVERYKYTDVAANFAPNYGVSFAPITSPLISDDADFTATAGVYVGSIQQSPVDVTPYYNKVAMAEPDSLLSKDQAGDYDSITALNTALAHDTLLIYVPRNVRVQQPIQVENTLRGNVATMVNRRVLILLEQGADATVIFYDRAADKERFLSTQVVEVIAKDNSRLDMYEIEETHTLCSRFSNVYIQAGRDCNIKHNSITLFNGQTRNLADVRLCGEGTEVTLGGCVVADKGQRVDNNTLIDHRVPCCTSNELYKYVLDEHAVGAFAGKILVRHDAQKTASQETNANLCASPEARMYTQPMLEIYADDVKCAHGSTVGVMDEQSLFYMQQRGISQDEARMLLKFAFVGQVIDQITYEPLRVRLHELDEKRFRGELDKCVGCALCK